jgi:hypothetical protein
MEFEPMLYRKGTVEYRKNGSKDPSLNKGDWHLLDEQNIGGKCPQLGANSAGFRSWSPQLLLPGSASFLHVYPVCCQSRL